MGYDSWDDTLRHLERVRYLAVGFKAALIFQVDDHDLSKLKDPEKATFDEYTPKLKGCAYGSDEYKGYLEEMENALLHHYTHNRHHPEHFADGVDGMDLIDIVEMLCDWKAAGERHADGGNIFRSIQQNTGRFDLSPQLVRILTNTAQRMWTDPCRTAMDGEAEHSVANGDEQPGEQDERCVDPVTDLQGKPDATEEEANDHNAG